MSRSHRRWGAIAAMPLAAVLLATDVRADDRAEIDALKKQIEALQRSDAAKQRQLDEMMNLLRQMAPQAAAAKKAPAAKARAVAAAPAPVRPAQPASAAESKVALDDAVREIGAGAPPAASVAGDGTTRSITDVPPPDSGTGWLGTPGAASVPGTLLSRPLPGQATLRLLEPSFDILAAGGWSTANDQELSTLEGGAHDPNRRGFTLQQAELSLFGAVDPYFNGEAHIVFTPDGVELEEAFGTTQRLPWDLQLKTGYYLTEFGRINPTHPHAWVYLDQPIVNTRMFGPDGLRSVGVQASWLMPLPFFSELYAGVQNANEGEFTSSFLSDPAVGGYPAVRTDTRNFGDLLYLARWANAWNFGEEVSALLGFSGLFGPNSTGGPARTFIWGTDFTLKWRPVDNFRGWPFVLWQTEAIERAYTAEPYFAPTDVDETASFGTAKHSHGDEGADSGDEEEFTENIPGQLLRDWGMYTQVLWGFTHPWAAGVRFEWASGSGQSYPEGRMNDPLRDDRFRFSPLLQYQPSEFSRIRLQYNYDHSTALPGETASTVWLGLELLYGTHPAHKW